MDSQAFSGQTPLGHSHGQNRLAGNMVFIKKEAISQLSLLILSLDFQVSIGKALKVCFFYFQTCFFLGELISERRIK